MAETEQTNNNRISKDKRSRLFSLKLVIGVYLPVIIILLAVIFPYIVSSKYLVGKLSSKISEQTHSKAEIKSVHFSWLGGIKISGLSLSNSETKSIIRINDVIAPVNLFDIIVNRQLSYMRIKGLHIELCEGEKGQIKLPVESNVDREFQPFLLPIKRMQIEKLNITLRFRDKTRTIFNIPWLEIITKQNKQNVQWFGHCQIIYYSSAHSKGNSVGNVAFMGNLSISDISDQKIFVGTIKTNWQNLSLNALHIHKISQLKLTDLEGLTEGALTFKIFPDLHLKWDLRTKINGLAIKKTDGSETNLPKLSIVSIGTYDPIAGNMDMSRLDIESPSINLKSKFNLDFENAILAESNLKLSVKFHTQLLSLLFPENYDKASFGGDCEFNMDCQIRQQTYKFRASLNADNASFQADEAITKFKGQPANLSVVVQANKNDWPWMTVKRFKLKFGNIQADGFARLPRIYANDDFDSWLMRARNLGQIEFNVGTEHIESLGQEIIPLRKLINQFALSGAAKFGIDYTGQNNIASTELKIRMEKGSTLRIKDLYIKPKHNELALDIKTYWPWQSEYGKLSFLMDASCGKLNISTYERPAKFVWAFWDKNNDRKSIFIDVISDIRLKADNIENMIVCSPFLKKQIRENKFKGTITVDFANAYQFIIKDNKWDINRGRTFARLDTSKAYINIPQQFEKDADQALRLTFDYRYSKRYSRHNLLTYIRGVALAAKMQISRFFDKGINYAGSLSLDIRDISKAITPFVRLKQRIGTQLKPEGQFACSFNWTKSPKLSTLNWHIDATGMGVKIKDKIIKPSAIPAIVKGGLSVQIDRTRDVQTYSFVPMQIQLGDNFINLKEGRLKLNKIPEDRWLKLVGAEPWIAFRKSPIKFFDAQLTAKIEADDELKIISPQLSAICKKYNAKGYGNFDVKLHMENSQLHAYMTGDIKNFSLCAGKCFVKSKEIPGKFDLDVFIWPDIENTRSWFCSIDRLDFSVGSFETKAKGYCKLNWSARKRLNVSQANLSLAIAPLDLRAFSEFSPILKQTSTAGRISSLLTIKHDNDRTDFGLSWIRFDNIKGNVEGYPFALDGQIEFSDRYLACDELNFLAGNTVLSVNWQSFASETGGIAGYSDFHSQYVDIDELRIIARKLSEELTSIGNTQGTAKYSSRKLSGKSTNIEREKDIRDSNDNKKERELSKHVKANNNRNGRISQGKLTTRNANVSGKAISVNQSKSISTQPSQSKAISNQPDESYQKQIQLMHQLAPIFKWAMKSDLLINFNSVIFRYTDYAQHVTHNINDLLCKANITQKGKAVVSYWGKLSGGMIMGTLSADLSEENPTISLSNQLYDLKMNPSLQPLIENFFPGLKVTGRISIDEHYKFKMFRTSTAPNNPVGSGEMTFIDGYMIGPAAPEWVTKIFPQLNFTKYEFSRMRNWFYKTADGRVHNNMIYRGKPWNIYIEGDSYPNGRIKYEIGVDILARFESQYWSSVGQGRVPIFTIEGLIRNGKFAEEKIRYVPPYKVIYQVFIKNNIITGAYRVLKRQIKGIKKDKNSSWPF